MIDSPQESPRKTTISRFYKYVVWPALRNLIQDLVTAGEISGIKAKMESSFISVVNQAIEHKGEGNLDPGSLLQINPTFGAVPDWIKAMVLHVLADFSATLVRYFKNTDDEHHDDLEDYIENAMVVYLFDIIIWKFVHDQLIIHAKIPVNGMAEIKEKVVELLKQFLDDAITLKEAKHAVSAFLSGFEMDSDLGYEIVTSYLCGFFEIIEKIDPANLHDFIESFSGIHGAFLDYDKAVDEAERDSRNTVMRWFEDDVININMKTLATLFPELTRDEIEGWKVAILANLKMLLDNLLAFEDFEKRVLAVLKSPKLQFDIEKPESEKDLPDKFLDLDDRSSSLESIVASAELIFQEAQKDPTLKDFAARIIARRKSLEKMYM